MYMSVRYNFNSKRDQSQAKIDAQREAARREAQRRAAKAVEQETPPTFRGAALELQSVLGTHFEVMISGPAETGKTYAALYLVDRILRMYPNVQAVLARKIRDTIVPSVLGTYRKLIADRADVKPYGGQKPEWFDYSNGSRLWLAGLDDPGKALSSERDIIYINQAEELSIGDWETLTTRATGRAANIPHSLMLGDCNPAGKNHWITQRKSLYLLKSYHKDNPTLFDDYGEITPRGRKTLEILSGLSEPRRSRYFLGLWASAEGQVYPTYDENTHVIERFAIPVDWPRLRIIDFGFNNPFVCLWAAYDQARDRLICYREIYMTGRVVEDHAAQIGDAEGWQYNAQTGVRTWTRPIKERENIIATICDHDAEDRATLERHGISNVAAFKAIKLGIEAVQARLKVRPDTGDCGLYFFNDMLIEVDPELDKAHLPKSTLEEFEGYVWEVSKTGKPNKELPVDRNNHGMDTVRYLVAAIDDIGIELEERAELLEYEEEYSISPI